jgi:mono/diheme cytochrome c family protein
MRRVAEMTWIIRSTVVAGVLVLAALGYAQKRLPLNPGEKYLMDSVHGPELYRDYCSTCHGKDGKGNGPTARWLKVAPPDLTGIAARNGGVFPFLGVQKIISGEERAPSSHGTREMPVWGPILSEVSWDQDLGQVRIYNLAKYLEEIQSKPTR